MKTKVHHQLQFPVITCVLLTVFSTTTAQDFDAKVREKTFTEEEWGQYAKSQTMPILVEKLPLRVLASDGFSTNLESQIYVGSRIYPCFTTKGKTNELSMAGIHLGVTDAVSIVRKKTKDNSYLLSLLSG